MLPMIKSLKKQITLFKFISRDITSSGLIWQDILMYGKIFLIYDFTTDLVERWDCRKPHFTA